MIGLDDLILSNQGTNRMLIIRSTRKAPAKLPQQPALIWDKDGYAIWSGWERIGTVYRIWLGGLRHEWAVAALGMPMKTFESLEEAVSESKRLVTEHNGKFDAQIKDLP